jgi:hypothetical protein
MAAHAGKEEIINDRGNRGRYNRLGL